METFLYHYAPPLEGVQSLLPRRAVLARPDARSVQILPHGVLDRRKYYQGTRSPNSYERELYGYSAAWMHHKGRNRHHYEYWTDIDPKTKVYRAVPMPRKFFVEMVMDRIAACKIYHGSAYTDADALNYLVHAEEVRDGSMMHPDTRRELLYVLTMLRDRGEKETFRFLREVVLAGKPFAVPAQ